MNTAVQMHPEQAAISASTKDSSFIAGGTNLLDLMKLEIETPIKLVDITRLTLEQVETTADGGLRIGTLVTNSDLAGILTLLPITLYCPELFWPERLVNCVIKQRLVVIFYSARVATTFIRQIAPAISVNPVQVVLLSTAKTVRWLS